ncbi:MAG: type II/IV secretion system ATPase subunit [Candidatus Micrarchaeota archaeon]
MILKTKISEMIELLKKNKKISIDEISKELNWEKNKVELTAKVMEKTGIINVIYPTNVLSKPFIRLEKEIKTEINIPEKPEKIIAEYELIADTNKAKVKIKEKKNSKRPFYFLEFDQVDYSTKKFLEEIKEEIAKSISIETGENQSENKELKEKFINTVNKTLLKYFPENQQNVTQKIAGILLHEMYGMGKLELLMKDYLLEEISINSSKNPIGVYHREFGWLKTNISAESEELIENYAAQIARKVGREITNLNPILDAHLITGDRVNATLAPVSSSGNTITIRKFSKKPWTITDFISPEKHTMNSEMAAFLWLAIHYEMNLMVAGSTASGKTSALNTLCAMIPSYHRIITIEDVRELMLPDYLKWNWVPLTTRNPNPEGLGEISMFDLMMSSLRMRPDRIILGEMRQRKEAEVLFEAMHTGHSVYSTIHADSGHQLIRRLTEPPIEIPSLEIEALHLALVQYRDRKTNKRRTMEISEIDVGTHEGSVTVNTIYRWSPRTDSWDKVEEPNKFYGELNLHTGLTEQEIEKDLEERKKILEWMVEKKINTVNSVGEVMKNYYSNSELVLNAAEKKLDLEKM